MTLIAGLGSPHGDDQLGWVAIDRLRPLLPAGVTTRKVHDGIELLACLEGQEAVIVIDAVTPAGQPGTIRSFQWPCPELASCVPLSTHGLGLVEAFHLAETLGRLPRRVSIYTVEAHDTSPGRPLSIEIARRLYAVVEAVLREVTAARSPEQGYRPDWCKNIL
jgi:hydrogenase maturation protease